MSKNYRKIYEDYHGEIPKDETGRTFDIHHLDGNRDNNSIDNLVALSRRDHYWIHYNQGDWGAALFLAKHSVDIEEIKEVASKNARRQLENGTHISQNEEWINLQRINMTNLVQRQLENGTHISQNEELKEFSIKRMHEYNASLLATGKHHFQTEEHRLFAKQLVQMQLEEGTHNFQTEENRIASSVRAKKRIAEGKNNFQTEEHKILSSIRMKKRVEEGNHPSKIKITCIHCDKTISKHIHTRFHGDNCKKKIIDRELNDE